MTTQTSSSQFERCANLKLHAVQLAMQHRATQGLMWFSSENCYFSELQDGPNTALEHESRELSREFWKFHQWQFHVETHWLIMNVKNSTIGLDGTSFHNKDFVKAILNYIYQLYQFFTDMNLMAPSESCIITPYAARISQPVSMNCGLERILTNATKDRRGSKVGSKTLQDVRGQFSTMYGRSLWMNRLDPFREQALKFKYMLSL